MQYGGMVGDDENDGLKRLVLLNDKGKKGEQNNYVRISLIHISMNLMCH